MPKEWILVFDNLIESSKHFSINTSKTIRFGTRTISLSRLHDGFFALKDECSHDGASLSKGRCTPSEKIECPWHHYLFDIRTGKNIGGTCPDTLTYQVKTENNQLFILL